MSNAQQEEIEIQRADKEASQALLTSVQAQRNALLAAAKYAVEHIWDDIAHPESIIGHQAEVMLRRAIRLAESE